MSIAGGLAGAGAALYYLSGNTEFGWNTYQTLPAIGFNGIPVALLATNSPLGVIFSASFMAYLQVSGMELKNNTPYNEHLTSIIIAVIVYFSAFSLLIKQLLSGKKKGKVLTWLSNLFEKISSWFERMFKKIFSSNKKTIETDEENHKVDDQGGNE